MLKRIGKVAYRLALPDSLSGVHPVFHVSMLRKYIPDASHVLKVDEVELQPNLSYEEVPVRVMDHQVRKLRTKEIPMVKVMWRHRGCEEMTWETEADMRAKYPQLFDAGNDTIQGGQVGPLSHVKFGSFTRENRLNIHALN